MAVVLTRLDRESELLALRLQEEELQAQQDAIIAQRLAVAYACREEGEDEDDEVEFVMEVAAGPAAQEEAALAQVNEQLTELRKQKETEQGRVEAENLIDLIADQQKAANDSRLVAEVLDEHESFHEKIKRHDAAFARRLERMDSSDWEDFGDEIADPLDIRPPRQLPSTGDEPTAANPARGTKRPAECSGAGGSAASARPSKMPTRQSQRLSQSQPAASRAPAPTQPKPSTPATTTSTGAACPAPSRPTTRAAAKAAAAAGPSSSAAAATGAQGAGPSSSARAGPALGTVECMCCMDRFPDHEVTCAGADAASSSTASAGCGHYFCVSCMTEYVRGAIKDRKCPVPCPMASGGNGKKGCNMKLSRDSVLAALEKHPKDQQAFGILEAEQAIDPSLRIYCPHKDCSMPLLRPEEGDLPDDGPTACPACFRGFCPRCLIPGWHNGYSCSQFQALPAHQRSAEDAAMLQFSARQQWKQCPQCRLMVERSEGCNHMLCRCGANFCYACGQPYKSKEPTADNVHGTPGCGCPLFDVPAEEDRGNRDRNGHAGNAGQRNQPPDSDSDSDSDDGHGYDGYRQGAYGGGAHHYGEDDGGDDEGDYDNEDDDEDDGGYGDGYGAYGGDQHGGRGGGYGGGGYAQDGAYEPWRGGRRVIRRHCRHSASLHDCPYGNRCWYWHEAEDGPL